MPMPTRNLPHTPLTEYLYRRSSALRCPVSGTFELSPVCNFNCRMCYIRKSPGEVAAAPRPILTLPDWRRIAGEACGEGLLFLLLTGGEPLLWPDFWTLYEELVRMGLVVSVNTNGSLIDGEAAARFRRLPPKQINLTLYGVSDAAYRRLCGADRVFSRVDRAITALREAGVLVKLNCSLTPDNAGELEDMVRYAKERGLTLTASSYMFPPIRRDERQIGVNEGRFSPEESARYRLRIYELQNSPEAYERLLRDILAGYMEPPGLDEGCVDPLDGRIRCRAGSAAFWVTWDGFMTPCGLMPQPRADLCSLSFPEGWRRLTEASARMALSGSCESCSNFRICHPCAAMAMAETGRAAGIPTYLCKTVQELRKLAAQALSI